MLKYFNFTAVVMLSLVVFVGCNNGPTSSSSEDDGFSGQALSVKTEDEPADGKIGLRFNLVSESFDSANTETILKGFEGYDGDFYGHYNKKENDLFFWTEVPPGIYIFTFKGNKDDVNEDVVDEDDYWVPQIGKYAIEVDDDFKLKVPDLSKVLRLNAGKSVADSSDTVIVTSSKDTITVSKTKGTIVLLGDSVIFKREPSKSDVGYDTIKIDAPAKVDGIDYDDLVEYVSSKAATVNGKKMYKLNLTFDTILVKKYEDKEFKPFTVGYVETDSAWKDPQDIKLSSGRYEYATVPLEPGLIKLGVGGSYKDGIWADSSDLSESVWGLNGIIGIWLFDDGRVAPWSLVDTTKGVAKDSIVLKDSVIIKDSIVIRDSIIFKDSVVTKTRDSVVTKYKTVVKDSFVINDSLVFYYDTVEIVVKKIVSFKGFKKVEGGIEVFFDSLKITSYPGMDNGNDTIDYGQDSAFVEVSFENDTTIIYNTDTLIIIDKGLRDVTLKGIALDTSWIDTVTFLKGVAERDSAYRILHIHEVLTISNGDSTFDADTNFSTKLVVLSSDTFDLVMRFVSATPATGDTFLVNFKVTEKIFDDSVAYVLGFKEDWNEKIKSTSKSGGYFNFTNVKMVKKGYRINFVSSGTAWAEQPVLLWSYLGYQERSSVDLTPSLNDDASDFDYAPPAAQ